MNKYGSQPYSKHFEKKEYLKEKKRISERKKRISERKKTDEVAAIQEDYVKDVSALLSHIIERVDSTISTLVVIRPRDYTRRRLARIIITSIIFHTNKKKRISERKKKENLKKKKNLEEKK